jgi:hypothetical protein
MVHAGDSRILLHDFFSEKHGPRACGSRSTDVIYVIDTQYICSMESSYVFSKGLLHGLYKISLQVTCG